MAEIMNGYIVEILKVIVLAVVSLIAIGCKTLYQKYVSTEIKQKVAKTVVRCVEQIYVDLHGQAKLEMAMRRATYILKEYGIEISEYELTSLIEAAVNEFNNTFHKEIAVPAQPPDEGFGMTD